MAIDSKDVKEKGTEKKADEPSDPTADENIPIKTLDIEDIAILKRYVRSRNYFNLQIIGPRSICEQNQKSRR